MNPFLLSLGKYEDKLSPLTLVRQPVYVKENSEIKPAVFRLKIDLMSHPIRDGRVG